MSNAAVRIIGLFGGTRAAARKIGVAKSTVQSWKENGHIPARRQQLVLDRARALGVAVTPASFFEGDGALQVADSSMSEKFVQSENGEAAAR